MKYFFIFLVPTLFSISAFSASKYDYKKLWSRENLKSNTVALSLFIKQSPINNVENVATMTISENNTESSESILKLFKKTLGPDKWTTDKIDGIEIHEKFDFSSMTLFRLAFNPKTKQFSVGSVKTRYLVPSYVELHLLQVESLTNQKSKTTASFLYDLIIAKAFASNLGDRAASYVIGIGQNILAPTNASIDNVAGAITNTNGSIDRVGGSIDKAADKVGAVSGSIDRAGDKVDSAADKLTGTFSKKNAAELSAVATLTSAVTAGVITFAASATYKLARTMFYEAIGEFTPEVKKQKVEAFEASMKTFSEVSPQMEKLEQKLSLVSSGIKELTNKSMEENLAQLEADLIKMKKLKTEGAASCTECLEKEILLKVQEIDAMKDVIKRAGVETEKKRGQICSEVDSMYQGWISSEAQLATARRYIIQDARVYMGLVNTNAKVELKYQEQRMQDNACASEANSNLSSISSADQSLCDQDQNSSRSTCRLLRAYRKEVNNCLKAGQAKVQDDLKASLAESAANFNEMIANLSSELSRLDCGEKNASGVCVEPGAFAKRTTSFRSQFVDFAKQCPDRGFAKILRPKSELVAAESSKPVVVSTSPVEKKTSWFSNFFNSFRSNNETTQRANQAETDLYTGG